MNELKPARHRLGIQTHYGNSIGNLIDRLAETPLPHAPWLEVEEVAPHLVEPHLDPREPNGRRYFALVADNITHDGRPARGLCGWASAVVDLDDGHSDAAQCFGMSEKLRWNDVEITPDGFAAPSLERLQEAMGFVVWCSWDPRGI